MPFEHLVITRFSTPAVLAGRPRKVDGVDEYLQYRMRLFRVFCIPSMQSQTCKNFKWFVLFGDDTPDWLRLKLNEYEQARVFIPLYAKSFAVAMDGIRDWITINVPKGDDVFTTRFDNDDALSADYVAAVQGHYETYLKEWIQVAGRAYFDPADGQQVTVRASEPQSWRFYKIHYRANPFVSMVERVTEKPALTIYHKPHGSIRRQVVGAPVKAVLGRPMWMQILHGKNLGNGLWTKRVDTPSLTQFPFLKEYFDFGLPAGLSL